MPREISLTRFRPSIDTGAASMPQGAGAGAVFGRALQQVGGELGQLASDIQARQMALDAKTIEAARSMEARKRVAQAKGAFLTAYEERKADETTYATLATDAQTLAGKAFDDATKDLEAGFGGEVRAELDAWYEAVRADVASDARKQGISVALAGMDEALNQYSGLYLQGNSVQRRDALEQIEGLYSGAVSNGLMTASRAQASRSQLLSGVYAADMERLIGRNPNAALGALGNLENMPELDPIARTQLMARGERERQRLADKAAAEYRAAQARKHDEFMSDLQLKVDAGEIVEGDIETLYQAGQLKPGERTALTMKARAVEEQRARADRDDVLATLDQRINAGDIGRDELEEQINTYGFTRAQTRALRSDFAEREAAAEQERALRFHVADAVTGNAMLDMEDKDQREAWNARYREFIAPKIMQDRDSGLAQLFQESSNAGALPPAFVRGLEVGSLHADPQVAGAIVDTYQRLLLNAPQLAGQLNADTRATLNDAALLADGGLSHGEAIARARENLKRTEGERKAARTQLSTKGMRDQTDKALQDFARSNGGQRDAIPPRLEGQFRDALELAYVSTGNLDAAMATATQELAKTWGETMLPTVGGDALMHYPPEKVYGSPRLGDAILEQFREDTAALGKDMRILSDADTARGKGYLVYRMDDGTPSIVLDQFGRPRRWAFDYASSKAKERADRQVQKTISDAKRQQQKIRELEKDPTAWSTAKGGRALTPADRAIQERIERNR